MAAHGNLAKLLVIFIAAAVLIFAGVVVLQKFSAEKPVACTQEAKLCSDGSAVGRTGPSCEFPLCPKEDLIVIEVPRASESISSPLAIKGKARGTWFFEASFPIFLVDENGKELAVAVATAKTDWMTTDFVDFEAVLSFPTPATQTGHLVFKKDNPSGLPEHDDELRVPVVFSQYGQKTREVSLYYYNSAQDTDQNGNLLCSQKGLIGVKRTIPVSQTPIQDTIKLLLKGGLSQSEREAGIITEYPLEGFSLKSAALKGGILTLEFDDTQYRTTGGSCRVGVLWFQIEATAKQFPGVQQVNFLPEELFQP